MNVIEETWRAH